MTSIEIIQKSQAANISRIAEKLQLLENRVKELESKHLVSDSNPHGI